MLKRIYSGEKSLFRKILMIKVTEEQKISIRELDEQPPIFKSWLSWYSIVIAALVIELILFYIITKVF